MEALKDSEQLEYPNLGSSYSQVHVFQMISDKKQRRYKKETGTIFRKVFWGLRSE